MSDVFSAALEDAGGLEVKDNSVKTISTLAIRQLDLMAQVEVAEAALDNLKAQLKQVSELDLPTAMLEVGMREFKLESGAAVKVKKVYGASIKVENREPAFAWLIEKGHEALIKTDVLVEFGKGKDERAEAKRFLEDLKKDGFEADLKEGVHAQTLKAFAREQIEAGETLPEFFTVFQGETAVVTLPKVKK